jgi:hypothetical protein
MFIMCLLVVQKCVDGDFFKIAQEGSGGATFSKRPARPAKNFRRLGARYGKPA